ncbi:MAG: DUF4296 domain-containing protein [Flavobacteriales bacterium]|nr:DUF4296 domain-containing protein [Flavobacteriales bacterium]
MNKAFLVILSGLFFSCSQRVEKQPKHILSESQMIEVLVEVHLLESASQLNMIKGMKEDSLNIRDYYEALFEPKEYSFEEFNESFTYYSKEPKTMELLLDSVLTRIQMME